MVGTFQLERSATTVAKSATRHVGAVVQRAVKTAPIAAKHANGHANGKNGYALPVSPASVIPFDGDSTLKDF